MQVGTRRCKRGWQLLLFVALLLAWNPHSFAKPRASIVILPGGEGDAEQLTQLLSGELEWVALEATAPTSADPWQGAQAQVEAAKTRLSQFDHKGALKEIAGAEEALEAIALSPHPLLRELNLLAARAQLAAGNKSRARSRLLLVHSLEPSLLRLDTKLVPPELATHYRKAISNEKGPGRDITLKLVPSTATLRVDGKVALVKDKQVQVSAGDHYLSVQADGFHPRSARVASGVRSYEFRLKPLSGAVQMHQHMLAAKDEAARGPALLAIATGEKLEFLFVVRGSGEVLIFRSENKSSTAWIAIDKASSALNLETLGHGNKEGSNLLLTKSSSGPKDPKPAPRWYQNNKVLAVGVLGLLIGVGAVAFVIQNESGSDSDETYQTGMWEWDLSGS